MTRVDAADRLRGFPPIAADGAVALILGSMPGAASLAASRYYAHPRNAFWPIMHALFGIDPDLDYEAKCQALVARRVAVWDVLKYCRRNGSLDAAIERDSIEANDFEDFLDAQPALCHLFFNGAAAEQLFRRHVYRQLPPELRERLTLMRLPSTSPAHAAMNLEQKRSAWQPVRDVVAEV